jgi:hypothetical protein
LDSIGEQIGVKDNDLSPWYNVDTRFLSKFNLNGILNQYRGSMYTMLSTVYSDHDWKPWKFKTLPVRAIQSPEIIEKVLQYVEKECRINRPEEWYSISGARLDELGVKALFGRLGGMFDTLRKYRPSYSWDPRQFLNYDG